MLENINIVKPGLALVFLGLFFGLSMGIVFGVNEDAVKGYINSGIETHQELHDEKSSSKIWRYAQRSHFHALGIAAFSLVLILLIRFSTMMEGYKKYSSVLIGLGSFYPLAWFSMFILAPSLGRSEAHHHWLTTTFVYIGVGGLVCGLLLITANLFFGLLSDNAN